MEIFEPKYDVGTDSWVLELKGPFFCYTTPSNSSIGSSSSTTPPHPDWRNGVEMSSDSVAGGAHTSFFKRRWRSTKGAVARFWTCCSNPPLMPLEEAHVALRDSASDAMQWTRTRHGVYYSEMDEEEREKKRKEAIGFCNDQWRRPSLIHLGHESVREPLYITHLNNLFHAKTPIEVVCRPETEELHNKQIIAEEKAIEMELKEDVLSHLLPSKLKDGLTQEDEDKKNKIKNMNLDDSIMEADIVYSITGLCEPSDPKNIVIKRSHHHHHHHHLEECRIEDKKLERKLEPLGLKVNQIKQDRHCLFRAVEDQLALYSVRASQYCYRKLREMTATYMRKHMSDFLPFFQSSSGRFEEYCMKVELGDAWGGQLELSALSNCLRRRIVLFSGNFHDLEIGKVYRSEGGSSSSGPSIMLSYHMHPFGLREHYNSVVPDV